MLTRNSGFHTQTSCLDYSMELLELFLYLNVASKTSMKDFIDACQ
jgi:hypothetical protein